MTPEEQRQARGTRRNGASSQPCGPPPGPRCDQIAAPPARTRAPATCVTFDAQELTRLLTVLPPITADPSPIHAPPFRADSLLLRYRVVVNVPVGDVAATAGGVELAAAETAQYALPTLPVPVLVPGSLGGVVTVGTFDAGSDKAALLSTLRLASHSFGGLRALRVGLRVSGVVLWAQGDQDLSPAGDHPLQVAIYALVKPNQRLEVVAQNTDPHSAALVEIELDGWTWPVVSGDDSEQSLLLRADPALNTGSY